MRPVAAAASNPILQQWKPRRRKNWKRLQLRAKKCFSRKFTRMNTNLNFKHSCLLAFIRRYSSKRLLFHLYHLTALCLGLGDDLFLQSIGYRSEERRVGKECRSRW